MSTETATDLDGVRAAGLTIEPIVSATAARSRVLPDGWTLVSAEQRLMQIDETGNFIQYFESVRGRTQRVLDVIPPDQLEWRPRAGAFSFGDLIRHIAATERYMFAENARGNPSAYPGHGEDLARGWNGVRAYMSRLHEESVQIIGALPPSRLTERCMTPGGAELQVWKWLRAMIEHEVHHRGQIYLMLGLIGVAVPPLYGLTEAQVRANSIAG